MQSADAFAASYDILMKAAELIHKYVPSVKTIGGYARIDNFIDKTENQLREMKNIGLATRTLISALRAATMIFCEKLIKVTMQKPHASNSKS